MTKNPENELFSTTTALAGFNTINMKFRRKAGVIFSIV